MLMGSLYKTRRAQTSLRGESGEKFTNCFVKDETIELSPKAYLKADGKKSADSKTHTEGRDHRRLWDMPPGSLFSDEAIMPPDARILLEDDPQWSAFFENVSSENGLIHGLAPHPGKHTFHRWSMRGYKGPAPWSCLNSGQRWGQLPIGLGGSLLRMNPFAQPCFRLLPSTGVDPNKILDANLRVSFRESNWQ